MPMKITLGWLKKIGQPDYGSLGANCNVEFEADQALLQKDPKDFHKQVQNAFAACRQAGPTELPRRRGIGLRERMGDMVQLGGKNADARIRDGESKRDAGISCDHCGPSSMAFITSRNRWNS
jgi:hypothetical protein